MNIQTFSLNHIDVLVDNLCSGGWRFTGIYGHPEDEQKLKTGALLEHLNRKLNLPWVCGGDFHLMLTSNEKQGGNGFNINEAEILRKATNTCNFIDLGYLGHHYTWTNNRGGDENMQERLDRFFAT